MRELDSIAVVGAGRLGTALAAALRAAGASVEGPLGRGADPEAAVVLLCVPDAEIAAAFSISASGTHRSRTSPDGTSSRRAGPSTWCPALRSPPARA